MSNVADVAITYNTRGQTTTNGTNSTKAEFNDDSDITTPGKKGLVYVMTDSVRSGMGITNKRVVSEPLILRAAAGDWIKITLHNCFDVATPRNTFTDSTAAAPVVYGPPQSQITDANATKIQLFPSTQVGLHAQLVSYDVPTAANGINVGFNSVQTVAPPAAADVGNCLDPAYADSFYWYAGELSLDEMGHTLRKPVEFGAVNLLPSDPLLQHQYGLVGALIVEPMGSSWVTDPGTGTLAAATVTKADGATFRDFVALFQVNVLLSVNNAQGVNYRSEPRSYRYQSGTPLTDQEGQARYFSNTLVWADSTKILSGDPQTPIF